MPSSLTFAITGATGLVGKRLSADLRAAGHTVHELRRGTGPATWNVDTGEIVTPGPVDVVIHLAGRNIATRWTARARKEIWDSRVPATQKLAAFLATLPAGRRPGLLLSASAVGIYGNRGDEVLTEDSPLPPPGQMFMADICREWEAATAPAEAAGIRVIHPRIGIVLAKDGGALAKLATPTKLLLGGPVGKGTQWMPWISLTDLSGLLIHLATAAPDARGPVNAAAPPPGGPVRQHEFMRTLGRVLHRPTVFPLPAFMVKLAFGQMGNEALLSSLRVVPARLPAGFRFEHSTLEAAIRAELGAAG
jgi:uncharacterized protein (TIGR01777 family)